MFSVSPLARLRFRRFLRNPAAVVSLGVLFLLYGVSLAAPWVCRYSPHEVIPESVPQPYAGVQVSVAPISTVGRFNLMPDGRIIRAENTESFFKTEGNPELASLLPLDAAAKEAIARRFKGEASPEETFLFANCRLRFPKSEARPPPPSIRVYVSAPQGTASGLTLNFPDPGGRVWQNLSLEEQRLLLSLSATGNAVTNLSWRGAAAVVTVKQLSTAWPFKPIPGHPMGLDSAGRDVFSRVVYGLQAALSFGLVLALWSMLFGLVIGAVQGYFGGWTDILAQRFIEIWSSLPFLYVMILAGAVLGRSFLLLLVCYGIFNWIGLSYYMRGEFLRLRGRPFVEAARCLGLSRARIIFRHILPNALTPMITLFPFSLVGAVASLAALDFLGFGLPPLSPSLGELLQQGQQYRWAWWLILYPSLALFIVMFAAVLVGEGVRAAFDPKQTTRLE